MHWMVTSPPGHIANEPPSRDSRRHVLVGTFAQFVSSHCLGDLCECLCEVNYNTYIYIYIHIYMYIIYVYIYDTYTNEYICSCTGKSYHIIWYYIMLYTIRLYHVVLYYITVISMKKKYICTYKWFYKYIMHTNTRRNLTQV